MCTSLGNLASVRQPGQPTSLGRSYEPAGSICHFLRVRVCVASPDPKLIAMEVSPIRPPHPGATTSLITRSLDAPRTNHRKSNDRAVLPVVTNIKWQKWLIGKSAHTRSKLSRITAACSAFTRAAERTGQGRHDVHVCIESNTSIPRCPLYVRLAGAISEMRVPIAGIAAHQTE